MINKASLVLAILIYSFTTELHGQNNFRDFSFEFQAYPTGLIPGLRFEANRNRHALHMRLGYNWIRHGNAGKHDDERGQGVGGTIGYKRYFKKIPAGYYLGARTDFWSIELDWKDNIGQPDERSGTTEIFVVQPTAEFGYLFELKNNWVFSPNIAFGFEVNVKTKGEPTGEGPILLLGFQIGKRFNPLHKK